MIPSSKPPCPQLSMKASKSGQEIVNHNWSNLLRKAQINVLQVSKMLFGYFQKNLLVGLESPRA